MNSQLSILYPVFGMFLLILYIFIHMGMARIQNIKSGKISLNYFKTYQNPAGLPEKEILLSRNFTNLFEVPTLFFVVCILYFITRTSDAWSVGLAWLFVASRCVHSFIHITNNKVFWRMRAYLFGWAFLTALFGLWLYRCLSLTEI